MFTLPTQHYPRLAPTKNRTTRELGPARALGITSPMFADDDAAHAWLAQCRWQSGDTQVCPHCGGVDRHYYKARYRRWRCRASQCARDFTVFSGTKFHGTKLSPLQVALLLFIWQEGAEGISSREVAGLLKYGYQSTHVQIMKLREALWHTQEADQLQGIVEVDAAFFNRHMRPPNLGTGVSHQQKEASAAAGEKASEGSVPESAPPAASKEDREARRRKFLHNPNMHALIAFVERLPTGGIGRVRTGVVKTENQVDIDALTQRYVHPSAVVHTDESGAYSMMIATAADHKRVKHRAMFVDATGLHTNHVECFFAEMRRSQAGRYHRFGLGYLQYYAAELGWRLEMRDKPNDVRLRDLAERALRSGTSSQFADVWNKRPKAKVPKPKVPKPAKAGIAFPIPAGSFAAPPRHRRAKKYVTRNQPRGAA